MLEARFRTFWQDSSKIMSVKCMSLHEKPSFYLSEALSKFLICFIFEVSKRELCVFENVEKEFFVASQT